MGGKKKSQNTFSWCHQCDRWHWDSRLRKDPFCPCGAKVGIGSRRGGGYASADFSKAPWRDHGPAHQHPPTYQRQPSTVTPLAAGAGVGGWVEAAAALDPKSRAEFAALVATFAASAKGQAGAGFAALAAELEPAPVVQPSAQKLHGQATAEHRAAIRHQQEIERRKAHFLHLRGEIHIKMDKNGVDLAAAEAALVLANKAVEEKAAALARVAAVPTEGKEEPGPPAADAFDPRAFAEGLASKVAGEMDVDPEGGDKQPRDEEAAGIEEGAAAKRPRFKSQVFVDKVASGIQEGLAAQMASQEAEFQRKFAQQAGEMERLRAQQAEAMQKLQAQFEAMSKTVPAAAATGGGGEFRTTG